MIGQDFRRAMRVAGSVTSLGVAASVVAATQADDVTAAVAMVFILSMPYGGYYLIAYIARAFKTPRHLLTANIVSGALLLATSAWLYWALFIRPPQSSTDALIAIPCVGTQVFVLAPLGVLITARDRSGTSSRGPAQQADAADEVRDGSRIARPSQLNASVRPTPSALD